MYLTSSESLNPKVWKNTGDWQVSVANDQPSPNHTYCRIPWKTADALISGCRPPPLRHLNLCVLRNETDKGIRREMMQQEPTKKSKVIQTNGNQIPLRFMSLWQVRLLPMPTSILIYWLTGWMVSSKTNCHQQRYRPSGYNINVTLPNLVR